MNLYQTYKNNRYRRFDDGGSVKNKNFGAVVGFGAEIGAGIIDATAVADPTTGRMSTGATVGKSALSGAAAGAMLGPVGAGVGAVLGAGLGLLTANKEKREAKTMLQKKLQDQQLNDSSRSSAMLTTNPSLIEGYKNSGYFKFGGELGTPAGPGKEWTPPPAGASYKTAEEVEQANSMAKRFAMAHGHVDGQNAYVARKAGDPIARFFDEKGNDITGKPQPGRALQRTLPNNVTIKDIKSEGNMYWYEDPTTGNVVDVDPGFIFGRYGNKVTPEDQAKVLASRSMNSTVAVKANGGSIKAPLATAFMIGGRGNTMSSDGTDLTGKSHEEGGIEIPAMNAELEGNETTKGDYVFSDRLGFADIHRKLSTMKGKIEKKPATQERVNSIRLINDKENMLIKMQEHIKQQRKIS